MLAANISKSKLLAHLHFFAHEVVVFYHKFLFIPYFSIYNLIFRMENERDRNVNHRIPHDLL